MKPLAVVTLLTFLVATTVVPAQVAAQGPPNRSPGLALPVTGTGGGGTFTGTFQLQRFVTSDGAVAASGLLTGTLTTASGATTTIARNVVLPVQVTQATCDILHLDIGPIALDLLGLQINLSRIVLDIVAESGAGNLLGNLLCAVANLLNNPNGLASLLNRILAALLG
jgi:hypothetical protein